MPLYTLLLSSTCHLIGVDGDEREKINEYNGRVSGTKQSVYSPHCVIELVATAGECAGCHGNHDLINGYCGTCRTMGANEAECLNPSLINRRSANGRDNSRNSFWRKYQRS
jgi:hypothetical protein